MSEPDYDIFELDPASYKHENINLERGNYASVTLKTGDVFLVPVSLFETHEKEQVITQIHKLYYQHCLLENHLKPEKIRQIAQQLMNDGELLNLIARQVTFNFKKLYEYYLKIDLEIIPQKPNYRRPNFTRILDKKGDLKFVKLNLDKNQINQVIKHFKKEFVTGVDRVKIWEEVAVEMLTAHVVSAVERMQQDLGIEAFNNTISYDRLETFYQDFKEEQFTNLSDELSPVLRKLTLHFGQST